MGRFINYPVRFMLEIDLFAELFEKYDPKIREHIDPAMTLQNYIDENGNEAFMADLERAMERYKQETKREVQEFGVDLDPDGPRYLWRTPEEKEAAVRLIEEQYPLNEGDVICYGHPLIPHIQIWSGINGITVYNGGGGFPLAGRQRNAPYSSWPIYAIIRPKDVSMISNNRK